MKEIQLTHGYIALVDDEDFERVSKYSWWPSSGHDKRAITSIKIAGKWRTVLMHRLIMRAKEGQLIDHKNRNPLDNRRQNLRFATRTQNALNQGIRSTASTPYKGVRRCPPHYVHRPFMARIGMAGERLYIGCFATAEEAARAYDAKAIELHGDFACLNFPADISKNNDENDIRTA